MGQEDEKGQRANGQRAKGKRANKQRAKGKRAKNTRGMFGEDYIKIQWQRAKDKR